MIFNSLSILIDCFMEWILWNFLVKNTHYNHSTISYNQLLLFHCRICFTLQRFFLYLFITIINLLNILTQKNKKHTIVPLNFSSTSGFWWKYYFLLCIVCVTVSWVIASHFYVITSSTFFWLHLFNVLCSTNFIFILSPCSYHDSILTMWSTLN